MAMDKFDMKDGADVSDRSCAGDAGVRTIVINTTQAGSMGCKR